MRLYSPWNFGGPMGFDLHGKKLDSLGSGKRKIRVGDRVRGCVKNLRSNGIYVDIGVKERGFVPARELEEKGIADLAYGQKIYVQVYRITKEADGKINIDLKLPEGIRRRGKDVDSIKFGERIVRALPKGFPPAEEGIIFGELPGLESGFRIEIPGRAEKVSLPGRLSLGLNRRVGSSVIVIRTGIRDSDNYEICCEADFAPVAEKLLNAVSSERIFKAFSHSRELDALSSERQVSEGRAAFFVTADEQILEDIKYLPQGVLQAPDPYLTSNEISSGMFYFRLTMEEFQPGWTAWDLVKAMAKKPLLAEPA